MSGPLRIGVSGPFTGPRSAYGDLLREAAERSSVKAEMAFADDMAQVDQAVRVANAFVKQGIDAVVGHFNSDCARAAGRIYRDAGIPFLMPAATAPDLIAATSGYRICAADDAQVDVLAEWLSERGQTLSSVWQDGSPYAARLAALMYAEGLVNPDSSREDRPVAILGAHHAVADEIKRRKVFAGPVFVPDDCAIAEFDALIANINVDILCATASPGFSICVMQAFQIINRTLATGQSLKKALESDPIFMDNQHRLARFEIIETTRQNRVYEDT